MTAEHELEGLDPFDLLDEETGRLEEHLATLEDHRWRAPTRCEGWDVLDLVAHLASSEAYNHACLDGDVAGFLARAEAAGATDLDAMNAWGIRSFDGVPPDGVLAAWREASAETRRRLRERRDGTLATMVGDYPVRLQAFHLAAEVATHADDAGLEPPADAERSRTEWRARFARFAIVEVDRDVEITALAGTNVLRGAGLEFALGDAELVEASASRLPASHPLPAELRALVGLLP